MKAIDLIHKNKSSLNFSILKNLLEDEEIELTEDLIKYLKETPNNTNYSILGTEFGIDIELTPEYSEDESTSGEDDGDTNSGQAK